MAKKQVTPNFKPTKTVAKPGKNERPSLPPKGGGKLKNINKQKMALTGHFYQSFQISPVGSSGSALIPTSKGL